MGVNPVDVTPELQRTWNAGENGEMLTCFMLAVATGALFYPTIDGMVLAREERPFTELQIQQADFTAGVLAQQLRGRHTLSSSPQCAALGAGARY